MHNKLAAVFFLFLICRPALSRADEYWIQLQETPHLAEALSTAKTIHPTWVEGGRIPQMMIRKSDTCAHSTSCYRVYVGVYASVVRALRKGIQILRVRPWARVGFAPDRFAVALGGNFASVPMRFTAALAKASRLKPEDTHPVVAETVCARAFGYHRPGPAVPAIEKSSARIVAWDRALLVEEKEHCLDAPRIVGGPPQKRRRGVKLPPIVHAPGKRCLRWVRALTERDLTLSWFPAACLVPTRSFKKARTTTRWGPITYRYALNRIGRVPGGILYEAVFRSGRFPPNRMRIVIADRYPEPHRLGWDRLGAALFEGRGLIVKRLNVRPPPPKVSPLWKRPKRAPNLYRFRPPRKTRKGRRKIRRVARPPGMRPLRRRAVMRPGMRPVRRRIRRR